jgi:hypothetical protein
MPLDYSQYEPHWVKEFRRCEQWIEDALEYSHGTHNIQDIFEDVMNGRIEFWPGKNCALITQVTQYPQKKMVHVFLAGGNISEIEEIEKHITIWAKQQGCTALSLAGRPGWTKSFLNKIGYKNTQVQMIKEF